ncbi:MAG: hypothetical protein ACKN9T_09420 [Candidatus Methylumidiphilus sp.]
MAGIEGIQTTYKATSSVIRSVVNRMSIIGHKTPLLNELFGGKDGAPALNRKPGFFANTGNSTTAEWYNKKLRPSQMTLGANYTSGGTSLTITPASDALYIGKGQILIVDNERFIATAAGVAAGTVAVAGAKFGTSAANHTSAAKIRLAGRAQGETSDTVTDNYIRGDVNTNYYQGIRVPFSSTWKNQQVQRYDDIGNNWLAGAEQDATLDAFKSLEEGFVYGLKNVGDGTDTDPAAFGGLLQYAIGDDYGSATLSSTKLSTSIKDMWVTGGEMTTPDLLICSGTTRLKLSQIYGSSYTVQVNPGDAVTAGTVTEKIRFDFATVDVLPIHFLLDTDIFLLRRDHAYMFPLGDLELKTYQVQQQGVRDLYQVYGEYSVAIDLPEAFRRIYNFVLP